MRHALPNAVAVACFLSPPPPRREDGGGKLGQARCLDRTLMQGKVDDCRKGRGDIQFRLAAAQRKHLEHLHMGSVEWHVDLYQLGTDPNVLKAQAM